MKIEFLYPDNFSLFGDSGNIKYLKQCLPDAEFINTEFHDVPAFASGKVDMIYMGAGTENSQEKAIKHLMPYREQLKNAMDSGTVMLFTGNAQEVLFKHIENEDGTKVNGLGLLDFYAKRRLFNRYNSLILAKFMEQDLIGFKTQFTMVYGDNSECSFAKVERGIGINEESKLDGIHVNNFIGTSIIGPILVMNPYFTEYLMGLLGVENPACAFREDTIKAYNQRLHEFQTCAKLH